MKIMIGIVDDHAIIVSGLSKMIGGFQGIEVVLEAYNGEDLLQKLEFLKVQPDILLLDVGMPGIGGIRTAEIVSKKYPEIKMVALSSDDSAWTIINMMRAGCCAYLTKDFDESLENVLLEIYDKGHCNNDAINTNYRSLLLLRREEENIALRETEKTFLELACSDLTYKQIASKMHVAERTVDGYREECFRKLDVVSRTGMVLEALRRKLISL